MNKHASRLALSLLLALASVKAVAHATPPSPWQASYEAETAGKLEQALEELKQLPAAAREGYVAQFRRGWLLYRLGRYADSSAAYANAVNLEPAGIEARVAMLLPLMALTKWHQVELGAKEVLKRDPENYLALQRLAYAKFSTKHYSEAEVLYRRILVLYPSDIETKAGLGWTLLNMGKRGDASVLFSAVLELSPAHASSLAGLKATRSSDNRP